MNHAGTHDGREICAPPSGEHVLLPMERVIFGPGSVSRLAGALDGLGARRALLVTGTTLATRTDLVDRLVGILGDRVAGVFSETRAHVPRSSVLAAASAIRSSRADSVISFGGGTPNDTAKLAALCVAAGAATESDLDALHLRVDGSRTVVPEQPRSSIPHIAIPTTLSAGEFTQFAGSTDPVRRVKDAYGVAHLTPRVVILDPDMTRATPGWLWASSGMRAIDHAVETVCSIGHNAFADGLALHAVERLVHGLDRFRQDPDDAAARGECQVGAWASILSLSSVPFGLSHAIGHQLGARCGVPHGVTSCLTLPETMAFNAPVTADRQRMIARAMGIAVHDLTDDEAAARAAERVRRLVVDLGIKNRLRDWAVARSDLAPLAEDVMRDFMATTNPRPIEGPGEVLALLARIY